MSDLVVVDIQKDLATKSIEELEQDLANELKLTASSLLRAAGIMAELERRGKNMSVFRSGVGRTIASIASGRLAAEAVVAFVGRPGVLQLLDGLPLERQRELASGATIEVYDPDQKSTVIGTIASLPHSVLCRVFSGGREVDADSQRLALSSRKKSRRVSEREYRVVVNSETRTVRIGRVEVLIDEVLAAFAVAASSSRVGMSDDELRARMSSGTGVATASCHLTEEENQRLIAACRAKGLDRGEAVRRAVVSLYLL